MGLWADEDYLHPDDDSEYDDTSPGHKERRLQRERDETARRAAEACPDANIDPFLLAHRLDNPATPGPATAGVPQNAPVKRPATTHPPPAFPDANIDPALLTHGHGVPSRPGPVTAGVNQSAHEIQKPEEEVYLKWDITDQAKRATAEQMSSRQVAKLRSRHSPRKPAPPRLFSEIPQGPGPTTATILLDSPNQEYMKEEVPPEWAADATPTQLARRSLAKPKGRRAGPGSSAPSGQVQQAHGSFAVSVVDQSFDFQSQPTPGPTTASAVEQLFTFQPQQALGPTTASVFEQSLLDQTQQAHGPVTADAVNQSHTQAQEAVPGPVTASVIDPSFFNQTQQTSSTFTADTVDQSHTQDQEAVPSPVTASVIDPSFFNQTQQTSGTFTADAVDQSHTQAEEAVPSPITASVFDQSFFDLTLQAFSPVTDDVFDPSFFDQTQQTSGPVTANVFDQPSTHQAEEIQDPTTAVVSEQPSPHQTEEQQIREQRLHEQQLHEQRMQEIQVHEQQLREQHLQQQLQEQWAQQQMQEQWMQQQAQQQEAQQQQVQQQRMQQQMQMQHQQQQYEEQLHQQRLQEQLMQDQLMQEHRMREEQMLPQQAPDPVTANTVDQTFSQAQEAASGHVTASIVNQPITQAQKAASSQVTANVVQSPPRWVDPSLIASPIDISMQEATSGPVTANVAQSPPRWVDPSLIASPVDISMHDVSPLAAPLAGISERDASTRDSPIRAHSPAKPSQPIEQPRALLRRATLGPGHPDWKPTARDWPRCNPTSTIPLKGILKNKDNWNANNLGLGERGTRCFPYAYDYTPRPRAEVIEHRRSRLKMEAEDHDPDFHRAANMKRLQIDHEARINRDKRVKLWDTPPPPKPEPIKTAIEERPDYSRQPAFVPPICNSVHDTPLDLISYRKSLKRPFAPPPPPVDYRYPHDRRYTLREIGGTVADILLRLPHTALSLFGLLRSFCTEIRITAVELDETGRKRRAVSGEDGSESPDTGTIPGAFPPSPTPAAPEDPNRKELTPPTSRPLIPDSERTGPRTLEAKQAETRMTGAEPVRNPLPSMTAEVAALPPHEALPPEQTNARAKTRTTVDKVRRPTRRHKSIAPNSTDLLATKLPDAAEMSRNELADARVEALMNRSRWAIANQDLAQASSTEFEEAAQRVRGEARLRQEHDDVLLHKMKLRLKAQEELKRKGETDRFAGVDEKSRLRYEERERRLTEITAEAMRQIESERFTEGGLSLLAEEKARQHRAAVVPQVRKLEDNDQDSPSSPPKRPKSESPPPTSATEAHEVKSVSEETEREEAGLPEPAEPVEKLPPLIRPLNAEWSARVEKVSSTKQRSDTIIVTSVVNSPVDRRAWDMLVPPKGARGGTSTWLNDVSIDAWFDSIVAAQQAKAGWDPASGGAPPIASYNSAWYRKIMESGPRGVTTWGRKKKISGPRLLAAELVLAPANSGSHWVLLVVRPRQRRLEVLDSLGGEEQSREYFKVLRGWLEMELKGAYVADEWEEVSAPSQKQRNGSDCGVFTCVNALAVALARPSSDVVSDDGMLDARRMIAAVLLNRGFVGEWAM